MNLKVLKLVGINIGIIGGFVAGIGSLSIAKASFVSDTFGIIIGVGICIVGGLLCSLGGFVTALKAPAK